jgi:hypothetical protein
MRCVEHNEFAILACMIKSSVFPKVRLLLPRETGNPEAIFLDDYISKG